MTERKPAGMSIESWIERQIRVAQERGELDNLPGSGKPLTGLGDPDDELWWVKNYVQREGLSTEALLPTPLRLRREIERLPENVRELHTEQAVRELVETLNLRIVDWLRSPSGPRVPLRKVDADEVVEQWQSAKRAEAAAEQDRTQREQPAPRPKPGRGKLRRFLAGLRRRSTSNQDRTASP